MVTALDVESLLNLEFEPKLKATVPLPSPTFPIPGSSEVSRDQSTTRSDSPCPEPPVESPTDLALTEEKSSSPKFEEAASEKELVNTSLDSGDEKEKEESAPNLFYTPDEEETEQTETVFEESESISYVPPFNNPIYPNDSFTTYTSTIGK